ncbi:MAG: phage tail assembly chaperone [Bradymonadaceae bacterium]
MGNPAEGEPDFQLTDADGNVHDYHVVPHDPTKGTRIMVSLSGVLTGPVGELLDSAAGKFLSSEGDVGDLEVEGLIEEIDFRDVAAALSDKLDEDKTSALIRRILNNTYRDGDGLAKDVAFNEAYKQNYFELYRAVWEVVKFNGFLGSFGT